MIRAQEMRLFSDGVLETGSRDGWSREHEWGGATGVMTSMADLIYAKQSFGKCAGDRREDSRWGAKESRADHRDGARARDPAYSSVTARVNVGSRGERRSEAPLAMRREANGTGRRCARTGCAFRHGHESNTR